MEGPVRLFLLSAMLLALVLPASALKAVDISGTWQADGKPQRVLKVHVHLV
jgi:hypothetical protein